MEQTFTLPLVHKGKDYFFEGELITTGYTYKIKMNILGHTSFRMNWMKSDILGQ